MQYDVEVVLEEYDRRIAELTRQLVLARVEIRRLTEQADAE